VKINNACFKEIRYFTGDNCWHRLCALRRDLKIDGKPYSRLLSEIEYYLEKYGINKFEFTDFCNVNIENLDKLCCSITQKKLDIKWVAPVLIDTRMKYDFIERMKQAGCGKVIIELFSASDDLLSKIGAAFKVKDVLNLLRVYKDVGVDVGVNLIFGHPQEVQYDRDATINFLHDNTDLIGEITNVTPCMEAFVDIYPLCSPCSYRKNCYGTLGESPPSVFVSDFTNFISKLRSLSIPVARIYPAKAVFDEFEGLALRNKDLRFYFNKGKGNIFLKGQKLTSGLGLYTSIFVNNSWQDSEHADWKINKISSKKMILVGKWHWLPMIQQWEIELNEENLIRVNIDIEFLQEMLIGGEQQINIMLREEYNKWAFNDKAHGLLPSLFNDEWSTLFEVTNKSINTVKVETDAKKLPLVSLTSKQQDENYSMAVLNTSTAYNARILKGYKVSSKKYLSGKYLYFEGEIQIESRA